MNWKRQMIEDLRDYPLKLEAMNQIPAKIRRLEEAYEGLRSARTDGTPVSGGTSKRENMLIDNITERDKLSCSYRIVKGQVDALETVLNTLTDEEQLVLDRFYIHGAKGNVERLRGELGYERSQIYRIKDDALRKLTIKMYGVVEL